MIHCAAHPGPIPHARTDIGHAEPGRLPHIITVHLKSTAPSEIPGRVTDSEKGIRRTAGARAEGGFPSPVKRTSQALEVRRLIDRILDHMLVTRNRLAHYRGSEIHGELLHDGSLAFATDEKCPESGHAPVIAAFDFG
ncbi:hypothetical protein SUDANB176_00306 [Streptomyces sp. enrichment culture]|uniref:hypothetical protein n=1 Tax=Streptomyces sp. enrichment culture TaxID=1795815 RepID=UPI003F55D31B